MVVAIFFETAALIIINTLRDNLVFELYGSNHVVLNLDGVYREPGYIAATMQIDLDDRVQIENNLDVKTVGNYKVKYILPFLNQEYQLERDIDVVDTIPPTISLNGDTEMSLYINDEYEEPGAIANDNYDGDITARIVIDNNLDIAKVGEYEITYTVEDVSGNSTSVIRKVTVEKKPEPAVIYAPQNYANEVGVFATSSSDPIADYITRHGYDVSIGYYNLVTGKQYFYQANRIYYGASLIKTLDVIYLYDKGMVDETIKHYIDKAISVSDNNAHIYLVNYIGRDILKKYGIDLGAPNTLASEGNYGDTTVMDQLAYFKKAYDIAKNDDNFKAPFVNDFYNYIKIDGITTMHKHGYYSQWYHDAGIIFDTEPYIAIILTNHGNGNKYEVIHDLTNLIYKYHKGEL